MGLLELLCFCCQAPIGHRRCHQPRRCHHHPFCHLHHHRQLHTSRPRKPELAGINPNAIQDFWRAVSLAAESNLTATVRRTAQCRMGKKRQERMRKKPREDKNGKWGSREAENMGSNRRKLLGERRRWDVGGGAG